MIVRPAADALHLITQPDHAVLARCVMEHWTRDGLPAHPRRASILRAIERHDIGWSEVDALPALGPDGTIADFITAPVEVRRGVWPRGVTHLAGDPFDAALVAEHAIFIFDRFRADADWAPFFAEMSALRAKFAAAAGLPLTDLLRDYAFLRLADLISLTFCNRWTEPQSVFGYRIAGDGDARVQVLPYPFDRDDVPLDVEARALPNRQFRDADDLTNEWLEAPRMKLTGAITR